MQAVILAGGKGTRLQARLNGLPKPLVDVDGEPLLGRQLDALAQQGFDKVLVLVNHAKSYIEDFCHRRNNSLGQVVTIIDDGEPRGTAGALLSVMDELEDEFIVVYGDTLFNIDILRMVERHRQSAAAATLLLHPNDHPSDSDLVELDETDRVVAFHGYPHPEGEYLPNLVNAALYVVSKRALTNWRDFQQPSDIAKDLFPAMIADGAVLNGYTSFEYIKDLGTPSRLDKVLDHIRTGVVARASLKVPQAAVFLDRDGTLNEKRDYVRTAEDLILLPGAASAVRRLNEAEFRSVVVTNQPVLARGECSFAEMKRIHAKLETELGHEGAYLDGIFLCPHHPHSGYAGEVSALKIDCDCRKPKTGMIDAARDRFNIDVSRSWMVGDSLVDIRAAKSAGLRSILVLTGDPVDETATIEPDFIARDIAAAVDLLISLTKSRNN